MINFAAITAFIVAFMINVLTTADLETFKMEESITPFLIGCSLSTGFGFFSLLVFSILAAKISR